MEPGTLIGDRYRAVREIGAGAMGSVVEAIDRDGTRVAVKLLRKDLDTDASIRRRFRREASVLGAISHPGIVRIVDVGRDEVGDTFTVMELLEGETLRERLTRDGTIDPRTALTWVRAMADALIAVHDHGIVHGDLKPANVFLPRDGTPIKLVDFGLSKIEGLERLTRTGELAGTPMYMAPELLTGQRDIDQRVDIYALGVILYECLVGRAPFVSRHPGQLVFEIVTGHVQPITAVVPAIAELVAATMHKDRELRIRNAASLSAHIGAFLDAP